MIRRLGLVLVLTLAFITALAWIAGREWTLRWALGRVTQATHGQLRFEAVSGSLLGDLQVSRGHFTSPELEVIVENGALRFSLWPLLLGDDLVIERVAADRVTLRHTPGTEPLQPPADLTSPLALRIRALDVRQLLVHSGSTMLPLSQLRAHFETDGRRHRLVLDHLESPWATASASLQLEGTAPFALAGTVRVAPVAPSLLPSAAAVVSGTLLALKAEMNITAAWLSATGIGHAQPFEPSPLQDFSAEIDRLALHGADASLPHADLKGSLQVRTAADKRLVGELNLANEAAGTLAAGRLPLRRVRSAFSTDYSELRLDDLELQWLRGAPVVGTATLTQDGVTAQLAMQGLDLSVFHPALSPTQLTGDLALTLDKTVQRFKAQVADRRYHYDVEATREGDLLRIQKALVRADAGSVVAHGQIGLTPAFPFTGQLRLMQLDPAAFGSLPAARLNGSAEVAGWLKPDWQGSVKLDLKDSAWRGQPLSGRAAASLTAQRFWDGRGELLLGRNELRFRGALGASDDRLELEFNLRGLEQIAPQWRGSAQGRARLVGKWRYPAIEVEATGEKLRGPREFGANALQLRAVATPDLDAPLSMRAQIKGMALGRHISDAVLIEVEGSGRQHETRWSVAGPRLALKAKLVGGLRDLEHWQGRIEELEVSQPRAIRLETPATVAVSRTSLEVGSARLTASDARFELAQLTLAPGAMRTEGSFSRVPASLFDLPAFDGEMHTTLRFSGEWHIDAASTLNGFVRIRRESGDVLIGGRSPVASRLSEVWLNIAAQNNELRGDGGVVAGRGAAVRASVSTQVAKEGGAWVVPASAPIALEAEANLPYLDWVAPFVHPSLAVQGKVRATARGSGTYGAPVLEGRIEGAELAISDPGSGVRFTDGTLQAHISGDRLVLDAFQIRGKEGVLTAKGQATLRGERRLQLAFQAGQLALVDRPNWDINADSEGTLVVDGREARLEARIKVNRAQVGLPERGAPALSEDVVIKGRKRQAASPQKSRVALDISVDLGSAFRVLTVEHAKILAQALPIQQNRLDARLGGTLRIRSDPGGAPVAKGDVRVLEGAYTFLGKRLEIKRGTFRFDGPLGNPGLDILAMNEQTAVKVGASVTGTALAPHVRIVSDPDVPEQEKLSWLLFGRGGQSVDASLTGKASAGADSAAAAFGFQLSEKLFVGYEQGRAGAGNVMTLYSKLTDRLSVEARAGEQSGLRLFYTYELPR